jgi:methionine aminopeptidase
MQPPSRRTTKDFERRTKKVEKDCEMHVKPGMSLPKLKTEFDRAIRAVHNYWEMMKDPSQPVEQQMENYHNCVEKIRKAGEIHMEAEKRVRSEIDEQLQISGIDASIVISVKRMMMVN